MTDHPVPPAAGASPGPGFTGTAGLGARIGARLLDVLIVAIPASIVLSILGVGTFGGFGADSWLGGAITSLLWFGYFVFLESNRGATLGKQILNLKVIDANGSYPSTEVAAKRNVWMLFGLIPWIGGLLSFIALIVIIVTISSDSHNRGYHDTFAGTAVMRA
ncbi:MAG: RDD family protein [Actinobacteria bacterium]|jgi:uncharacterized RDD family membrane protein YckC|nr:RDD family protein [Actinomycetota bacterium]